MPISVSSMAEHRTVDPNVAGSTPVLPPGQYAFWTALREVKVEIVDARKVRFEHKDLPVITRSPMADRLLDITIVEPHHQGVLLGSMSPS
jgi:hypothetical protein